MLVLHSCVAHLGILRCSVLASKSVHTSITFIFWARHQQHTATLLLFFTSAPVGCRRAHNWRASGGNSFSVHPSSSSTASVCLWSADLNWCCSVFWQPSEAIPEEHKRTGANQPVHLPGHPSYNHQQARAQGSIAAATVTGIISLIATLTQALSHHVA